MFLDVFMDALIDTVKMLPFLYLACLAIEAIEHKCPAGIFVGVGRA